MRGGCAGHLSHRQDGVVRRDGVGGRAVGDSSTDAQKDILCDTLGALCSSGLFLWRVGGMRLSTMRGDGENSGKEGWL